MTERIAKCGNDCFNCPTYKEKLNTIEARQQCSAGWEKYLGVKLSPDKLRKCDGCCLSDSSRKTYYLNCLVRKCAMANELENCAYCSEFPCNELENIHSIQKIGSRGDFVNKFGIEIPIGDYLQFIEPYTGLKHLEGIRKILPDKDIKEHKKYSPKIKFADLDNSIDKPGLKYIHSILTNIYIEKDITYARLQTLGKKRQQVLKTLWAIGLYGSFNEGALELNGRTYALQKIQSMYSILTSYFKELKKSDIHINIIPEPNKKWQTPSGGLKKEGWKMALSFGESLKGGATLRTFKQLVTKLDANYGSKAFKMFNKADFGQAFIEPKKY